MARGMKAWLGAVGIGLALVAASTLPPSATDVPEHPKTPERVRYEQIRAGMQRAHDVLRAERWTDSLSGLAVETAVGGLASGLPAEARLAPDAVAEWKARLRAESAAIEPRDPRVIVGVYVQPLSLGAVPDTPTGSLLNRVTIVGTRNGEPYCLQVLPFMRPDRLDERSLRRSTPDGAVGACRLYAEHGLPSARIQSWLKAGGIRFAAHPSGWAPIVHPPQTRADAEASGRSALDVAGLGWSSDAPMFGLRSSRLFEAGAQVQGCLGGRARACERAVTDPELLRPTLGDQAYVVAHSSVVGTGTYELDRPFDFMNGTLLADLERDFGAEAFDGFWKSDQAVPEAFEAAFGTDMGDWLVGWVKPKIGLYGAGPGVPLDALPLCLVTLMVFGGVAMLVQRRRAVG